jgi:hypothetical protein
MEVGYFTWIYNIGNRYTATDVLFLILVHVKRNREYLFVETKYILAEKFFETWPEDRKYCQTYNRY